MKRRTALAIARDLREASHLLETTDVSAPPYSPSAPVSQEQRYRSSSGRRRIERLVASALARLITNGTDDDTEIPINE